MNHFKKPDRLVNTPDNTKGKTFLVVITPVVLYFILLLNGVLGVDFGTHWDEWFFISQAIYSIDNSFYSPSNYGYPSFCFYIVLLTGKIYTTIFSIENASLLNTDHNFRIYLRVIFLLLSSLTVIWVYWLALKVSKNYLTALVAGLIILSSFEFSYHSRWAVTDGITVQFAILSSLILFLEINRTKKIILSSVIAGLAMGTKYPAGIVCLNIIFFILIGYGSGRGSLKITVKELFLFLAFFIIGFVITTPGAIYDYEKFIKDILVQKNIYSTGRIGHTVQAGISHFSKISGYIIFELFSKNSLISLCIFLLNILGFAWALMKKKWVLLGLFVTMLTYIIYISSFKAMIVRNLLFVLPYFAVFASLGFYCIVTFFKNQKIRYVFVSIILITLLYSGLSVFTSSMTIKNKSGFNYSDELNTYLDQNTDKHFVFSERVLPMVEHKNTKPGDNSYLVFYHNEVPIEKYTANIRNQFEKVIGIEDVNFDYYPTWVGEDRIVIMKYADASKDILFYTLKDEDFTQTESIADTSGSVTISFIPQGLYYSSLNKLIIKDKVKAFIAESVPPFNFIDSAKSILDSLTFTATFNFSNVPTGQYYFVVRHRNSLETWSIQPQPYSKERTNFYSFTLDKKQAFGDNMIQVNESPVTCAIFSGDINQDGCIDLLDLLLTYNGVENFQSGYFVSDVTGDYFTDLSDILITLNNSNDFIRILKPF